MNNSIIDPISPVPSMVVRVMFVVSGEVVIVGMLGEMGFIEIIRAESALTRP